MLSTLKTSERMCWCRPVLVLSAQCRAGAHTRCNLPIGINQALAPSWQAPLCLDLVGRGAVLRPLLSHAACPGLLLWLHGGGPGNASMSLRINMPLSLPLPRTAQRACLAFKSLLAVSRTSSRQSTRKVPL